MKYKGFKYQSFLFVENLGCGVDLDILAANTKHNILHLTCAIFFICLNKDKLMHSIRQE